MKNTRKEIMKILKIQTFLLNLDKVKDMSTIMKIMIMMKTLKIMKKIFSIKKVLYIDPEAAKFSKIKLKRRKKNSEDKVPTILPVQPKMTSINSKNYLNNNNRCNKKKNKNR